MLAFFSSPDVRCRTLANQFTNVHDRVRLCATPLYLLTSMSLLFTQLYIGQGRLRGSGRNDLLSSFCAALQVTPCMDFFGGSF